MHRREAIMQAVLSTVTGLATTGANVERGRAYPVAALPALTVSQGSDAARDEFRDFAQLTRELNVTITAHAQATTQLEAVINAINTEVFAAMMADHTLGLGYVIQTDLLEDGAPEIEGEHDQPTARCDMQYRVLYRHSDTSTEA